jgi:murein DD-endopeptidase MepM/ murein hydrolase activator NlpD
MLDNFKIKHRHLLTTAGNIRIKYVAVLAITLCTLLWWGMSGDDTQNVTSPSSVQIATEGTSEVVANAQTRPTITEHNYYPETAGNGITPFLTRMGKRPYFDKPYEWTKTITVKSGDVLGLLMEETGLSGDDYIGATRAIKKEVNPQDIRPGHTIIVSNERLGSDDKIKNISYVFDSLTSVQVTPSGDTWVAEKKTRPLTIKTHAARVTIENSIFGSLGKADVPDGIINRMITAYSWTVDFQRDIWGGEEVEVFYETKETDDGEYVRSNKLLYANLKLRNKEMPIYIFEKEKGYFNYFEPDGQSIRRALMRTPVDGARLSSGYGNRTHPVLGYKKMHKGLDFAAPTGTPVYAAGDGTILRANWFSSFGNYVKIRHNDSYTTAYAHLHKFAKGIRKGTRVKQGQTIAYVGTTGRSTGPHLHYEVHKNGSHVNPHSVDLPLGDKLKGSKLTKFKAIVKKRNQEFLTRLK